MVFLLNFFIKYNINTISNKEIAINKPYFLTKKNKYSYQEIEISFMGLIFFIKFFSSISSSFIVKTREFENNLLESKTAIQGGKIN